MASRTGTSDAVHTTRTDGRWTNGGRETYKTQAEAITAGRKLARLRHTEHVIHGRDGQIRARNSYGNDPPSRPG
jgi:hypothetical protein